MVSRAKKKKRPGPGRPPKRPEDRCHLVTTSVPAAVARWLTEVGGGSASRGLRAVAVDGCRRGVPPAGSILEG